MILNDSSSLMGEKADVVLADYSGMTQDEVNASQQVASGQIVINWEQAYSNDYAAVTSTGSPRWRAAPSARVRA